MFFTQHFQHASFILKSLLHFENIFLVQSERGAPNLILLYKVIQFFHYHLLTTPRVPPNPHHPVYVFDILEIFRWLQMGGFISGSLLFHWFSSLFLCQHHNVFDVIALALRYLQHHSSCLGLHCYLGILWFHLNFRIFFSTNMKKVIRILFWIALIVRHFQQDSLFTILILPSRKHFIF